MRPAKGSYGGFTLIEILVIVVVMGIIAGIAIPRMTRAPEATPESAVADELAAMRSAIGQYQSEHNGSCPSNASGETFVNQLTQFTDAAGQARPARDTGHVLGPYLKGIPTLPVGTNKGLSTVTTTGPAGTGNYGWYYDGTTVWANDPASDVDIRTTPYNTY